MNWYEIKNVDAIDSPALVIYPERIAENIRLLKNMVGNEVARLRPHVKSNKIAEVCQMMQDAGITKFKCATIAECEMLGMIRAKDVLLSYQLVGPKINRFIQLFIQYPSTRFSCLVDNIYAAEEISRQFAASQLTAEVFIDVNSGMNRTGILPSKVLLLFEALQLLPAIKVVGLHAYDGHIRDTDVAMRTEHIGSEYNKVVILAKTIETIAGIKLVMVAGGSPTLPIHAQHENIECSPGTFIFWDWGYKHSFPDELFDYAALVITRVISIVGENTITTDLGHKSVAAENPLPRVYFLNAPEAIPISQSEEHLVLKVIDASSFKTGDTLYGIPVHICPTVALYEKAVVVENHKAIDEWKVIARNRKITI
ncbi:MAG: family PLP-dependent enzyme [Ferruginibacter sp.]|nr:family PLP-dependent enzyme [Ferruginibacter sp.]